MMKQLAKGAATYVPGAYSLFSRKRTGGTNSARYCYSVWLRHLVMADSSGMDTDPRVIAELGPGDSIGTGLAALLSGAEQYYALDIVHYANANANQRTLDELVELFRRRADIPGESEFPAVEPNLPSYVFPAHILTDERLSAALDEQRVDRIRASVANADMGGSMIDYRAPWHQSDIVDESTLDMVFSQAVLEHVDDLTHTYEQMHRWLRPTGFMSHSIDFKSHGSANEWNGHWAYSDFTWRIIRGKRPFMLNRAPHSLHLQLMTDAGFTIVCDATTELTSNIDRSNVSPRFREFQQEDLVTSSAFIQASI